MTVKEMHIGIDIGLQQLKSEVFDGLLPEEKDWVLNEAQYKFIDDQSNPISNPIKRGLESTQTRYDNISELITPAQLNAYIRDNKSVYAVLPPDYFNLVNDRSVLINNCNKTFDSYALQNVNYCEIDWELKTEKAIGLETGYLELIIINGITIYNSADYPLLATKPKEERDIILKDLIINLIINSSLTPNLNPYWEIYLNSYQKNSIILVDFTSTLCNINSMEVRYRTGSGVPDIEFYTGESKSVQNFVIPNSDLTFEEEVPNRLTKTEDIYTKLRNPYHTTKVSSPISILEENGIAVFHNKRFILNKIFIDYIRKPRTISLILGQNCELYDINNNHQKVVNIAVEMLAARMLAPTYNIVKQENIT